MSHIGPVPFPNVLRSAILGTQHGAPNLETGDAGVDALLAARDGEPAERRLLRAAATIAAIQRAGTPAIALPPEDAKPVADLRPRCGPLAGHDLRTILGSERGELLDEWLALANRFERRVPEEQLPALLSRGAQSTHLRAALHGAIDARGWWLAAQNPRWAYAIASDDDAATYDEADTIAARAAALRRLRRADAGAARARLEATWATEQPSDRGTLLEALETSLGPDDEPFLERCQDDKRREVRRLAADLLTRLPASAATKRLLAITAPLVHVRRALLQRTKLEFDLPAACTPAMVRDGIEPKVARYGLGERAWWLEQLLASVPPSHWTTALGATTGDLFEFALASEFAEPAVRGFATAIRRYRDAPALAATLETAAHEPRLIEAYTLADHDALDTPAREPAVRAALKRKAEGADVFLAMLRPPWSLELSRDALDHARGAAADTGSWASFQRRADLFPTIAARIDPRTQSVGRGWPESYSNERLRDLVASTLAAIEFRAHLFEHFADDA